MLEDVEARVASFILNTYREPGEAENVHLQTCPDAMVLDPDARDGEHGCDTGCDYARFEAVIVCPHGQREAFEWGNFGEVASILAEIDKNDTGTPGG